MSVSPPEHGLSRLAEEVTHVYISIAQQERSGTMG